MRGIDGRARLGRRQIAEAILGVFGLVEELEAIGEALDSLA